MYARLYCTHGMHAVYSIVQLAGELKKGKIGIVNALVREAEQEQEEEVPPKKRRKRAVAAEPGARHCSKECSMSNFCSRVRT
jgi:hypothetical protein